MLDFEQLFHDDCNIKDCVYKGWVGGRSWGEWVAGGWLYLLRGLYAVATIPRSASYRPRQAYRAYEVSH